MTRLAENQGVFWRLISAPEGVAAALAALPDRERALPRGLESWLRGDERLSALERLEVYANMYFFRLLDCLAEDFPATHAVVGHERFHGLAADYLAAHPSEHPSVRMLGRAFGDFLETHPLSREFSHLPDLARFEWDLLGAFDAADAEPLAAERLQRLAPDDWPALRLTLTPSLRILEARAPVQEVWSATTEGREPPSIAPRPTALRIWREGLRVFHRTIDPVELAALRAAERGERFAEMCDAAAARVGEARAASELVTILHRWLADQVIVGFDV
ncbi:MAG TPA: DNA-binding domain-containing protein [Candidatus Binatia bacterium]|nr:DNA-binding domain-containing protein [Candidatus Binatia bacterium]